AQCAGRARSEGLLASNLSSRWHNHPDHHIGESKRSTLYRCCDLRYSTRYGINCRRWLGGLHLWWDGLYVTTADRQPDRWHDPTWHRNKPRLLHDHASGHCSCERRRWYLYQYDPYKC